MKRQAEMTLDVGSPIKLVNFTSHERLSSLFDITAEIVVRDKVDFLPRLGNAARIEVFELDAHVRYFHAQLAEAHFLREEDQGYHYRLELRPWLHLLDHNRAYRVFEERSVVDILKAVLEPHSRRVDFGGLTGRYRPWKYCTQYRESDFAFVSRLMEREGIYYHFRHEAGEHVLVLCDAPSAHKPAPGYATVKLRPDWSGRSGGLAEALWDWHEHVRSGGERRYLLQSFDYQASTVREGEKQGPARNKADSQEVHRYTGDFVEPALAQHWAEVALQAARANQRVYTGTGDAIGLACGGRFTLDSQDAFDRGAEFVVTALDMAMDAEPYRTGADATPRRVSIEAVPADTPWRAPAVTPAPVAGPETAIVVAGGADDSNVDPQGRVRVRFLWKRASEGEEKARSCWLRVSYPSAGAGFGHVTLPRTGEEVIVDFLDGNPDRPILTGRVYNSEHVPAYALPEHRTRSLYRSQTIGASGSYAGAEGGAPGGRGYNELHFEDKGGAEQVYLRAQRDRLAEVMLDDELRVRRDRKTRVGRDRKAEIRGDDSVSVETGNHSLDVARGSADITAAREIKLAVGLNTIIMNEAAITLRVGMNSVMITQAGIVLNGSTITGNTAGALTLNSLGTATVTAAGLLTLHGGALVIL